MSKQVLTILISKSSVDFVIHRITPFKYKMKLVIMVEEQSIECNSKFESELLNELLVVIFLCSKSEIERLHQYFSESGV